MCIMSEEIILLCRASDTKQRGKYKKPSVKICRGIIRSERWKRFCGRVKLVLVSQALFVINPEICMQSCEHVHTHTQKNKKNTKCINCEMNKLEINALGNCFPFFEVFDECTVVFFYVDMTVRILTADNVVFLSFKLLCLVLLALPALFSNQLSCWI